MAYVDITHPFSPAVNRIIGNCMLLIGLLLWIWLPYSYTQHKEFVSNATLVTAKIIEIKGAPLVTFRKPTGETLTAKLDGFRPKNLKKGDEVDVYYSSKYPQRLEMYSPVWDKELFIAGFAFGLTLIGWLTRIGVMVAGPLKQSVVQITLIK